MFDVSASSAVKTCFDQPLAEQIWKAKYQFKFEGSEVDVTVDDTWRRVARDLATAENHGDREDIARLFLDAMGDFRLLPAGRILAGAGTGRNVTLSNTFVMRTIPDSVAGIMDTIKDAALTMQMGGGLGFDFSTIRPKGSLVRGLGCPAAGPLAAMDICDSVCRMLVTGMGRGAMMATMRCDHPDVEAFITVKSDRTRLRNFNLSVLVTDAFMTAVEEDAPWNLVWEGKVVRQISARGLWDRIMRQTYETAEPGVLFIDRINARNPLHYRDTISATNSCAEQPLPPNGTCPLASINLARLVHAPFSAGASLSADDLRHLTSVAVRLLDNAIDVSAYAIPAQAEMAARQRRIGIGVTGVGNALAMLGTRYGSDRAVALVDEWMRTIQNAAYKASALLAKDRGAFPDFDAAAHMSNTVTRTLDPDVQQLIAKHGLRNGTLTTIAPTGTISMLAGNVSSGIEPIFSTAFQRTITLPDGTKGVERVTDYAAHRHAEIFGDDTPLPGSFVTAADLTPEDHVRMQAAAQKWVDSGISKTVNCPEDISFDSFKEVYRSAFLAGCKGCTTYRPNPVTGAILEAA